jgi:hypothetical protein
VTVTRPKKDAADKGTTAGGKAAQAGRYRGPGFGEFNAEPGNNGQSFGFGSPRAHPMNIQRKERRIAMPLENFLIACAMRRMFLSETATGGGRRGTATAGGSGITCRER